MSRSILIATSLALTGASLLPLQAERVILAEKGQARLPIFVEKDAPEKLHSLAGELASYLSRISGDTFSVTTEKPKHSISLGLRDSYPALLPAPSKDAAPTWKERYRLLSDKGNLFIIGETPLAVQQGVFDLLHHLGYRNYFPGEAWEIIPQSPEISLDIDRLEEPAYATRWIFMGSAEKSPFYRPAGHHKTNTAFNRWNRRNRGVSAFNIRTGHAWLQMIRRHPAAFEQHPEWLSPESEDWRKENTYKNVKFQLQHEELIKLLKEDALAWLRDNPNVDTYSIDPSDGGAWPKDSPFGSPSDQVVHLANTLLPAIQEEFPKKKVAFYSYNEHCAPPETQLKPGAIVNVATGFIRGNHTVQSLMKGWKEKGAELGIREYVNVYFGSWDLPGSPGYVGFSPEKTVSSIQEYYQLGARYWIAESDPAWGVIGLGAYTAMRTLWNPQSGETAESIRAEFLEKCFGKASEPMKRYFALITPESKPLVTEDLTARLYDQLKEALALESTPAIRQRLCQYVAYTRFVELMYHFRNVDEKDKTAAYKPLAEWAYRNGPDALFSSYHTLSYFAGKDEACNEIAQNLISSAREPITEEELLELLDERIAKANRLSFEPLKYSENLVRSPIQSGKATPPYSFSRRQNFVWLAEQADQELHLEIRGMGGRGGTPRPIEVSLMKFDDPTEENVDFANVTANKEWQSVRLKARFAGPHHLRILDPSNYYEIRWPQGTPVTLPGGMASSATPRGTWSAYFYVPANLANIGGFSEKATGILTDENGKTLLDFSTLHGASYFNVSITPSARGRVFRIVGTDGRKLLMTPPPYYSQHPSELLIPAETLLP